MFRLLYKKVEIKYPKTDLQYAIIVLVDSATKECLSDKSTFSDVASVAHTSHVPVLVVIALRKHAARCGAAGAWSCGAWLGDGRARARVSAQRSAGAGRPAR